MTDDLPEAFVSDFLREAREAAVGNGQVEDNYEWEPVEQCADSVAAPEAEHAPTSVPLAPGMFALIDSLCDEAGLPRGTLVDWQGLGDISGALSLSSEYGKPWREYFDKWQRQREAKKAKAAKKREVEQGPQGERKAA